MPDILWLTNEATKAYTSYNMSSQVITIKIDSPTKKQAQLKAKQLGLSLSDMVKGLLKQFIITKPVTLKELDEVPNEYLKSIIKQAEENYKKGNTSPAFTNIEDELKWLEKQGI